MNIFELYNQAYEILKENVKSVNDIVILPLFKPPHDNENSIAYKYIEIFFLTWFITILKIINI